MIQTLQEIERTLLPAWLEDPTLWQSLDIDYHPPRVERIWRQHGPYRLLLHLIHPCAPEHALWHPHEWKSAMHVLNGDYEMGVGYSKTQEAPSSMLKLLNNSGDFYYEMVDGDIWHYVRPISHSMTTMLIGPPEFTHRPPFKADKKLEPLSESRKTELLSQFKTFY